MNTVPTPILNHWFGLKPPAEYTDIRWGARAIYHLDSHLAPVRSRKGKLEYKFRADIDLLWDRQQMEGGTEEEREAFKEWLDNIGLPALRRKCAQEAVRPNMHHMVSIEDGGYRLVASPRASHGYLYIGAWRL